MACSTPDQPSLPPGASADAASIVDAEALRQQALAFFHPLPEVVEHPAGPDTPEKVALGYKLFLDPQLSEDGTISCNSCHKLDHYGVDNSPTSIGVRGQHGGRNSPTVFNAALHNMQFWDGRATDVEQQAGMPMLNPVEMAIPSEAFIVKRLKTVPDYPTLFKVAFPADKDPLNFANICEAIGAFERTLLTPSRFDDFLKGNPTALTPAETAGLSTFLEVGCTNCHTGTAVGGTMLQKFGVHQDFRQWTGSAASDEGRKQVSGAEADRDLFKVPALRNVTKTAPYFHDGRVAQLDSAIRIMATVQLGKELTDPQLNDLKTFLEVLTGAPPKTAATSGPSL
ncbi:MAG: cytochrome-c peroxidase [Flavobacteriales bacterium]|nr:cytochrome-c peroxidase [Flavobacteriales bacterium]